jgi:inner membrane transporter RhtA
MRRFTGSIPPSGLVLLSSFAIQAGTALAKTLFDSLGSSGTVFVCKALAAVLLMAIWRPRWQRHTYREYGLVLLMGLAMAGMNLAIYGAIARIPLGIASAIEFIGPLSVAVMGSRRPLDLIWVALAAIGVFLIDPVGGTTSIDPLGIALALASAVCWAIYILVSVPVGQFFPGGTGLSLAMVAATCFLAIPGIASGGTALLNPVVLWIGLATAVLGTVLPYSLEFSALKRLPPRIFGVLMSIEPAIAALVGFLFLQETLNFRTLTAIGLVTSAAIGVTLTGRQDPPH